MYYIVFMVLYILLSILAFRNSQELKTFFPKVSEFLVQIKSSISENKPEWEGTQQFG